MKKLRNWSICLYQRILLGALAALGFSACSSLTDGEQPLMYGTPTATYQVKGKVLDAESQQPVSGIRIVSGPVFLSNGVPILTHYPDTTYTDVNGEFDTTYSEFPSDKLRIIWEKGTITQEVACKKDSMDVKVDKFTGRDGAWYSGKAIVEVNINIEKNTEQ